MSASVSFLDIADLRQKDFTVFSGMPMICAIFL